MIAALLFVSSAFAAPITLPQAVELALTRSPEVRMAREQETGASENVSLAFSSLFPRVNAVAGAQHRKDSLNTAAPLFGGEPYNYYDVGLEAVQPLFRGTQLWKAVTAARGERAAAALDVKIARRDLSLRVLRAFLGILLQERRIDALVGAESVQRELLSTAEGRVRVGRSQKLEVLQIRTQLALMKPRLAEARNNLRISAVELATLISEPEAGELTVQGTLDPVDWKRVNARLQGREALPLDLARLEPERESLESRNSIGLSVHLPSLDAFGTWGRTAFVKNDLVTGDATAWSFGLRLNIPIFSGLSSKYERGRALASENQLEARSQGVRDRVRLAQVRANKDLELARENFESSTAALALAREALGVARRDYKYSVADYQQLLTSERSLLDAEIALATAEYDYLDAGSRWFVAHGHEFDEWVKILGERT